MKRQSEMTSPSITGELSIILRTGRILPSKPAGFSFLILTQTPVRVRPLKLTSRREPGAMPEPSGAV